MNLGKEVYKHIITFNNQITYEIVQIPEDFKSILKNEMSL